MNIDLWTERYRSKKIEDYVFRDPEMRRKVDEWIADGRLPHLMFAGASGLGKTSLAELLMVLLDIPSGDVLKIPASRERKIEDVQNRIQNFITTWALGETGIKYIIMDEADAMSPAAQKMLRTDMETYSDVCRFIFTCNYPDKIIPAIHGRCQTFIFKSLNYEEFIARVCHILDSEDVLFSEEMLIPYIEETYPDLRKCIGLLQQNSMREGDKRVLSIFRKEEAGGKDYLIEMANLFKAGRVIDARKLIVSQAQIEEYNDIYRYFYENLKIWGDTQDQQDEAILIIKDAIVSHTLVCDVEINLAATMIKLARLQP
jgi:replication factor C small subunit